MNKTDYEMTRKERNRERNQDTAALIIAVLFYFVWPIIAMLGGGL